MQHIRNCCDHSSASTSYVTHTSISLARPRAIWPKEEQRIHNQPCLSPRPRPRPHIPVTSSTTSSSSLSTSTIEPGNLFAQVPGTQFSRTRRKWRTSLRATASAEPVREGTSSRSRHGSTTCPCARAGGRRPRWRPASWCNVTSSRPFSYSIAFAPSSSRARYVSLDDIS